MRFCELSSLKFWKMHGLGNDYIVLNNRDGSIQEDEISSLTRKICKRRFSIGADGLILLLNSKRADVRMRIINADGSEAEMCGNGIRCLAKYCYDNKIVRKQEFTIETLAGLRPVRVFLKGGSVNAVCVDMGKPLFERRDIPMLGTGTCVDEPFRVNGRDFKMTCLSVGNPHCVVFTEDVTDFPMEHIGPLIERNKLFPERVNVEFAQIVNRKRLRVRVWERGVGETMACGTGASAATVAGNVLEKISGEVVVELLGGELTIKYDEEIWMSGPAEKAFEGTVLR